MHSLINTYMKTNLRIHIVLVTKYRKAILTPELMDFCIEKIINELERIGCEVIAISGDDYNHIHVMAKIRPTQSISLVVQLIKQVTTYHCWQQFPEYLRQYYWHRNYLWSSGYFCSTIGDASSETVQKYIEYQG